MDKGQSGSHFHVAAGTSEAGVPLLQTSQTAVSAHQATFYIFRLFLFFFFFGFGA